jgi:hypothetical protein
MGLTKEEIMKKTKEAKSQFDQIVFNYKKHRLYDSILLFSIFYY